MGLLSSMYQKRVLKRYDLDAGIPYYCTADFPGLLCEQGSFQNSAGVTIQHYTFCYAGYDPDKRILFCPGIGAGHTEYFAEIETLCRAGYRVLTLDYTGCGESGGERLPYINAPTRDVMELLDLLKPQEEIIHVGHSLGGYTALNITHLMPAVTRAVIISGFVSISDEAMGVVKLRLLADCVQRFDWKQDPRYGAIDNRAYLAATEDRLLWIHSTDDPLVNYKYNAGQVLKTGNPNVRVITVENKKHTPHYSAEALDCMNTWMGEYERLIQEDKFGSVEERKAFFADKPISRMTAQDPGIYDEILRFIGE